MEKLKVNSEILIERNLCIITKIIDLGEKSISIDKEKMHHYIISFKTKNGKTGQIDAILNPENIEY